MIAAAYRDAVAMARRHRTQLWSLSDALLAHEDLDRQEIAVLLGSDPPGMDAPLGLGPPPAPLAPVVPLRRERARRRRAPAAAAAAGRAAGGAPTRSRPAAEPARRTTIRASCQA